MKQLFFILAISAFLFSCGEIEADREKIKAELREEMQNDTQDQTAETDNSAEGNTEETTNTTGTFDINKLKKGDKIESFTVKKVDYRPGEYFNIELEGMTEIPGKVVYNEFEDSWEMAVDKEALPTSKILINGEEYELFNTVAVRNRDAFTKALGGESTEMVQSGQEVWTRMKFQNFSIGQDFTRGRIGVAQADYTTGQ